MSCPFSLRNKSVCLSDQAFMLFVHFIIAYTPDQIDDCTKWLFTDPPNYDTFQDELSKIFNSTVNKVRFFLSHISESSELN